MARKKKAEQTDLVEAVHASDCAMHNAPALEPGPCDCSGQIEILTEGVWDSVRKHSKGEVVTSPDADELVSKGHARFI